MSKGKIPKSVPEIKNDRQTKSDLSIEIILTAWNSG